MPSLPVLVLNSGSSSIKFSVYEAGDGARKKLLEGAVDGIGTDLGQFWMKDGEGRKLFDQTPALPNRSVAFKLVADALNSGQFPAPAAIGHRTVCCSPTVRENQPITTALIDEIDQTTSDSPALWWLGQSGFVVKCEGMVFYVDPCLSTPTGLARIAESPPCHPP